MRADPGTSGKTETATEKPKAGLPKNKMPVPALPAGGAPVVTTAIHRSPSPKRGRFGDPEWFEITAFQQDRWAASLAPLASQLRAAGMRLRVISMFPRRLVPFLLVALGCALGMAQSVHEIGMLDIPGKPGFDGMAVVRGMVLLSHGGAGTVDIFDPAKRRLIAHVKGMSDPRGIAEDRDGGQVFIANHNANNIVVLSSEDWHVARTIALNGSPSGLEYIPAWGMLVATDLVGQKLMFVDLSSREQTNALPMPGTPRGLAFDNSRGLLLVTLQDLGQVVALNKELQVARKMPLAGSQPTGIVYDRKMDRLYVSVRYAVLSLNAADGVELSRVAADGGIDRLWLDDNSRTLYGAAGGSLLVMKADARLHAVDEVTTDVKGYSVAYDPDRKLVFFPGGREGRSKLLLLKAPGDSASGDSSTEAANLR